MQSGRRRISKTGAIGTVILLLVLVVLLIILNYAPPVTAPANTAIVLSDSAWSVQTDTGAATRTYNVTATFVNQGEKTYTFYCSISLADKNNNNLGFKGESMTLIPGYYKTMNETFTTNISAPEYVRLVYNIT